MSSRQRKRRGLPTPRQVWTSYHKLIHTKRALGGKAGVKRHIEGVYLTLCLRRIEIWQTFGIKVLNLATVDARGVITSQPAVYPAGPNCIPVRAQGLPILI